VRLAGAAPVIADVLQEQAMPVFFLGEIVGGEAEQ
jgi:hypothetical protein